MTSPIRRGTRIAHIGIAVRSLDALLPLYRDVLGLPEVPLDDADEAFRVNNSVKYGLSSACSARGERRMPENSRPKTGFMRRAPVG